MTSETIKSGSSERDRRAKKSGNGLIALGEKYQGVYKRVLQNGTIRYLIKYRDHAGMPKYKSTDAKTPKEAKDILGAMKQSIRRGDPIPQGVADTLRITKRLTLAQVIDRYIEQRTERKGAGNSHKDRRRLELHLGDLFECEATRITRQMIETNLKQMKRRGLSPKTINDTRAILRAAFNRAIKDGKIKANPCEAIEPYKNESKPYTLIDPADADAIIERAAESHEPRLRLFLTLLARTCARPEAIMRLRGRDIVRKSSGVYLKIPALKGGLPIEMPVFSPLLEAIEALEIAPDHFIVGGNEAGSAKPDPTKRARYETLRFAAKKLFNDYFGREDHGVKLYSLRHSGATYLLQCGMDIAVIRAVLGHKELRTTLIYAQTTGETIRKQIEKSEAWK